jgi:hypothetical protein
MHLPLPRNKKEIPVEEGDDHMATVIECVEGHYKVQKPSYGEIYVWCPERVVVECDCGQRLALTDSDTVCSCGEDHAVLVREALAQQAASHPWEVEYQEWCKRQGQDLPSEEIYQLELSRLN